MTYVPLNKRKIASKMSRRRQEKAAIATGGIDSGKQDVSKVKIQTFDEWMEAKWNDTGRTFTAHDMEAAWKAGQEQLHIQLKEIAKIMQIVHNI